MLLNIKETGYYLPEEFINSQLYFPNAALVTDTPQLRPVYRMVVDFGTLPAAGSKSVAHGIEFPALVAGQSPVTFTQIYGAASNTTTLDYLPLPFVSATAMADNLQVEVDATDVIITTGGKDYSAYTAYVVLHYLKS